MIVVKSNLKQVLDKRGMEQKEIAQKAGVREATISDMCRDTNKMFSRNVLNKLVSELNITDMNELISIIDNDE